MPDKKGLHVACQRRGGVFTPLFVIASADSHAKRLTPTPRNRNLHDRRRVQRRRHDAANGRNAWFLPGTRHG